MTIYLYALTSRNGEWSRSFIRSRHLVRINLLVLLLLLLMFVYIFYVCYITYPFKDVLSSNHFGFVMACNALS
jgi:hypothetical protein